MPATCRQLRTTQAIYRPSLKRRNTLSEGRLALVSSDRVEDITRSMRRGIALKSTLRNLEKSAALALTVVMLSACGGASESDDLTAATLDETGSRKRNKATLSQGITPAAAVTGTTSTSGKASSSTSTASTTSTATTSPVAPSPAPAPVTVSPAPASVSQTTAPAPAPVPVPAAPGSWVQCAVENSTCSFSGTREVRYGTATQSVSKVVTGSVPCDNTTFGDPVVGTLKTCWYSSTTTAASPAPAPTPAPAAAPAPVAAAPTPAPAPAPAATGGAGPRVSSFTNSGPITAHAGQVISGVRIQNPGGPCITIPSGATNVVVRDSDIGPCGGNANIFIEGANATVEYSYIHNGNRGVMAHRTSNVNTLKNKFDTFYGPKFNGTAIEYDYMNGGAIDGNVVTAATTRATPCRCRVVEYATGQQHDQRRHRRAERRRLHDGRRHRR